MSPQSRLGVDFGTSHTVAVLHRDGAVVPLLFDSSPLLPSAVYAEPDARLVVGADARNAARLEPARFEPHPKRRVDDGLVLLGDKEFGVEELFAAVLTRVRLEGERVLGGPVEAVTLTHPAVWGSARRLTLEDAAATAGFGDARLVSEPVAAASYFTHVLRHELPHGRGIVVADLGGGTFDASVVVNTPDGFEVLSVDGVDNLGGVDIDHALVALLSGRYGDQPQWSRLVNPQTMEDRRARRALYEDVRIAKEQLSRRARAELPVPLLGTDTHITRDELEELTRPLLERAVRVTQAVRRASRLPEDRLSDVLLVGGASRMPLVAGMLHRALGTPPVVLEQPELVVAQGATLYEPASNGVAAASEPTRRRAAPTPTPSSEPDPDREPHNEPPQTLSDRPTTAVRAARMLMWVNGAIAALWIFVLVVVADDVTSYSTGDEGIGYLEPLLALVPIAIAPNAVALRLAAILSKQRTRFTRFFALAMNAAIATAAAAIAIHANTQEPPSYIELTVTMSLLAFAQVCLSVTCVVLLNTSSASRWFAVTPPVTAPPPMPVPVARILMWIVTVSGAVAAIPVVVLVGQNAHGYDYISPQITEHVRNVDFTTALAVLPVLLVVLFTISGITAARLNLRWRRVWMVAVVVHVAIPIACLYIISVLANSPHDTAEAAFLIVVSAIVGALSIAILALLLAKTARQTFAHRA
ncbi:Hsp70 family protein [Stackebrandtia nassauensis]|uniref:Heat shock protein 70 n=1 Tax=Stackebrandtia nassauensis (strain DSM 44728 / CIP 108903 / NRRL B-16338 / NBRC 102104 / LLR-40K-21) TaxID=446470 RepID=D3PXK2_STANL|nr:Hsp70 family protein [Stackebrandtia nassauensis]ADD43332.1 Heat shock protein 70 [Stackebrandtia nassauensis DSM 44728]